MGVSYDSVVIGGGIIGLFTAWELSKAGQSVCVLERSEFGQEASWAAGGILSPLRPWQYPVVVNELSLRSQALYPGICEELQSISGIDSEWRQSGMLILDCPEQAQAQAWTDQHDQRLQWLTQDDLQGRFPGVARRDTQSPACWLPEVAQLRNPRLLKALVKALAAAGVELRAQTPVESLCVRDGQVTGLQTPAGTVAADAVVIAAGAWSSALIPEAGPGQRVYPVKGQMLLFGPVTDAPQTIVMQGERYVVPRADGRVLAGSTAEDAGFDKWTDDETLADLQRDATAMYPALTDARIEAQWAGLRPATQDEIPIIGAHAKVKGLYLNTGHYRSGIVMAPASARRLAQIML